MANEGGSVTLIFYKIDSLWKEPFLNVVAAAAQMSAFTHVELAIGNAAGHMGQMSNVCRVFNDDVGVRRQPTARSLPRRVFPSAHSPVRIPQCVFPTRSQVELASRTGRNPQVGTTLI